MRHGRILAALLVSVGLWAVPCSGVELPGSASAPALDNPGDTRTDTQVAGSDVVDATTPGAAPTATGAGGQTATGARPLDLPGLPNAFQVAPGLYRGAQPTAEGWAQLQRLGVKTAISLRAFHDDLDEDDHLLVHERVWCKAWHPEEEDVIAFLRIAADPARQPVFVHCMQGSDRTGMMCAVYRIVVQGWSNQAAIDEMVAGGFGFHPVWTGIVTYLQGVDGPSLRRKAGLPDPAQGHLPGGR